jgi:hypothetical protein
MEKSRQSIAADFSSRSNVSQTFAQLKARQQIQDCSQQLSHRAMTVASSSVGRTRGQRGESSSSHTIRDSTSNRLRQPLTVDKTGPRKPAYYDSTSQMLCQIALNRNSNDRHSNNNWKYHTAGIVTARRFTVPKTPPLSKIRGHRRTRLLSLFFLKHPSYPVLRSANVDRAHAGRGTIFDSCHVR